MSFNSIDIQVVFQRSNDISKIQTYKQEQGNIHNQQNVTGLKQEYTHQEKTVNKADYLEKKNIGQDGNKRGRQEKSTTKKKKQEEELENDSKEEILTHLGKNLDLHI